MVTARFAFFLALLLSRAAFAQGENEPGLGIDVTLDRATVFLHEQVVLTVLVRHPADARASWEPPPFDGFWAERLGTRGLPGDERGRHLTEFRRALFPTRTGEVAIAASKLVLVGEGGAEREIAVPGARILVAPLPDGVPADSLVGQLEVIVRADDTRLRLGKALALTVELAGEGNVWDARPPALEPLLGADVEVFPETPRVSIGESGGRATSRRTFRYALVPARAGTLEIGPVRFPYFDPKTGALASAQSQPLQVRVFAGGDEPEARAPWESRSATRPAPPIPWGWVVAGLLVSAAIFAGLGRAFGLFAKRADRPRPPSPRALFDAALEARDTDECLPRLASAVRAGIAARQGFDAQSLTSEELAARVSDPETRALLQALDRARFGRGGHADDALIERVRASLGL